MGPAQAVHFSIVPRNIDRDQKARLAFLAVEARADSREQRPPAHASSAAQATRLLQPPSLLRPLRPTRSMRVDPKESAGSRANRSVMRTL